MFGFLLVDKPKGITSFYALKGIRKIAKVKRVGFVGTLDPLASGLLVFAVGEATKFISFLEGSDKRYRVIVNFSAVSDTYDAEGELKSVVVKSKPSLNEVENVLTSEFLGKRKQVPPVFSAIWIEGKRAYDLARKGVKVDMKARDVEFKELSVVSYDWPRCEIDVLCSSGTYIRSLAFDLGRRLGVGGYVEELRRFEVGEFDVSRSVKWDDLSESNIEDFLLSPKDVFSDWYFIELESDEYFLLANGGFLDVDYSRFFNGDVDVSFAVAYFEGKCVGIVEVFERGGKMLLKFKRKFNL